jgi:hypothetical protein
LAQEYRYAVKVKLLDTSFLEKFFERIGALKKLDDWEDKLTERLAAKEAAKAYHKSLIQKQIKDAQRQRQETMDILADPEIPKTKQMKIDYAHKVAGLEAKIAEWENELEAPEDEEEDDEIVLYEIHSLLPDIASAWEKLRFSTRLRFVGALVRKVVVSKVAPSWFKIEIHWKDAIGNFIDVGYFKRHFTNRSEWSEEEKDIVRRMYPTEDAGEILAILTDRSWRSIVNLARKLGIKRERGRRPNSINTEEEYNTTVEDRKYEEENGVDPSVKKVQWCR